MCLAACHQVLEPDVERMWRLDLAACAQQVKPRQMAARDKVGDITRRQPQPSSVKLHNTPVVTPLRPMAIRKSRPHQEKEILMIYLERTVASR
jgi:hypothetical protein